MGVNDMKKAYTLIEILVVTMIIGTMLLPLLKGVEATYNKVQQTTDNIVEYQNQVEELLNDKCIEKYNSDKLYKEQFTQTN